MVILFFSICSLTGAFSREVIVRAAIAILFFYEDRIARLVSKDAARKHFSSSHLTIFLNFIFFEI